MAGGIDWFRWHHGSVTDPKFALVARKAGVRLGDVIAVWAYLLEQASASTERGSFGSIDCEAIDCLLGCEEGTVNTILTEMCSRGLINPEQGTVCSWDKRQPKREDDTAAERKRRQRDREHELELAVTQGASRNVTQCHADVTQRHDREEESREEEKEPNGSVASGDQRALPDCPHDDIVALYHGALPDLPRVRLMSDPRRKALRSFWRWIFTSKKSDGTPRAVTKDQALTWVRGYFERASQNDFLMGRGHKAEGHAAWQCDLDFLLTEKGKKHVIEKTKEAS